MIPAVGWQPSQTRRPVCVAVRYANQLAANASMPWIAWVDALTRSQMSPRTDAWLLNLAGLRCLLSVTVASRRHVTALLVHEPWLRSRSRHDRHSARFQAAIVRAACAEPR
jgi:hypothetical protein